MRKPKFQKPFGMHDILFKEQVYFQKVYQVAEKIAGFYGFQRMDTPILEESELFSKGIGVSTDVVSKQMYAFRTKGGDYLTLRPEFTAGAVRAFIENGMGFLPKPVKLYSSGPLFRYEHPQAGRYRQFHQFNLEVFGEEKAVIDAQLIQIFYNILRELKFKNLIVKLNSIGDIQCRAHYKRILLHYLKRREFSLCVNCRRRLRENPLRVLDCKEEKCQRIISQAPQAINYLCPECHLHFKKVLEFLDELEIPYRLDPYLVRGLDYYTRTVFEIFEESEEGGRAGALAGGGRYDHLVRLLRGEEIPAAGGAGGVERIVNLMKKKIEFLPESSPQVFIAQIGDSAKKESLKLFEEFRKAKIPIGEDLSKDSLRVQLAKADKSKVKYTLILGQKEALDKTIIIREMEGGKQKTVKLEKVVREIEKRLRN